MKTIILSPAHAQDTPGKQSPDGVFKEYEFSRKILSQVMINLKDKRIPCEYLAPENEPSISSIYYNRVLPTNKIWAETKGNCIYFALHTNAAGNGKNWLEARGVCAFTSRGQTKSDEYAELLYKDLKKEFSDLTPKNQPEWYFWRGLREENFIELMSNPPCILLEWLFQDSKEDIVLLENEEINNRLIKIITDFLIKIA